MSASVIPFAARPVAPPSNVVIFRRPGLFELGTYGELFDDEGIHLCWGWVHQNGRDGRITVIAKAGYTLEADADNFRADDAPSAA